MASTELGARLKHFRLAQQLTPNGFQLGDRPEPTGHRHHYPIS